MRKKLVAGSAGSQKCLRIPSQITLRINVYPRTFIIVPAQKREELVQILGDMIKRPLVLINARKTETRVRLKALTVPNELINTSYTMIRDAEVEALEREMKAFRQKRNDLKQLNENAYMRKERRRIILEGDRDAKSRSFRNRCRKT